MRWHAVDGEVAVGDELAGRGAGRGEAEPIDDVVEAELQERSRFSPVTPGRFSARDEVLAELPLQDAVDAADLLLLAQLEAVFADLPATDAVLAGRRRAALEGALGRIAAVALQEELDALAAAQPTDGTV